jgi:hypothetical protein
MGEKTLGKLIDRLFLREVSALEEDQVIKPTVKKDPNTINKSGQAKSPSDEEDQQIMDSGEVQLDNIISKINAIRAGRSLKDDDISTSLEEYFNNLSAPEQVALFAYLKGISEVVSGQKPGKIAVEPSDPAPRIRTNRKDAEPAVKPNVVVTGGRAGRGDSGSSKTTSPIKPVG